MLTIRPDWRRIFARAWSVRFLALSLLADSLELGVDYLLPALLPVGSFLLLSVGLKVAALVARFVAQSNMADLP